MKASVEHRLNDTAESRSNQGKTCPIAALSTANLTSNDVESNPGLRGERLVSNRVNRVTAFRD
jgi:hypothetical protein